MSVEFISGKDHYDKVVAKVASVRKSLWIGTADIKDLHVKAGNSLDPFLAVLAKLLKRGVEVRLIHAKEPGPAFREDFDRYPILKTGLERMLCPRVHFKMLIFDFESAYIGSGNLTGAVISYLKPERDPETGRTNMVPTDEEFTYNCQLAFIAAGFTGCESYVADAFGVELTARGNVADHSFKTNVEKVFVCGDMRRGQSLVVWGLREGRDCAAEVDRYLMGYTNL